MKSSMLSVLFFHAIATLTASKLSLIHNKNGILTKNEIIQSKNTSALALCPPKHIGFQSLSNYSIVLGGVSVSKRIQSHPSLQQCVELCRHNQHCFSISHFKNVCILSNSSATHLQEHVSSISKDPFYYGEKICLEEFPSCKSAWLLETVFNAFLQEPMEEEKSIAADSSLACRLQCVLKKDEYSCKTASWLEKDKNCILSTHNQAASPLAFHTGAQFLATSCFKAPKVKRPRVKILSSNDFLHEHFEVYNLYKHFCLNSSFSCNPYLLTQGTSSLAFLSHHRRTLKEAPSYTFILDLVGQHSFIVRMKRSFDEDQVPIKLSQVTHQDVLTSIVFMTLVVLFFLFTLFWIYRGFRPYKEVEQELRIGNNYSL